MKERFLICTAQEELWKRDVPVLFLGEWCKLYRRKDVWKDLDSETVPYHWDDRKKMYKDYIYLRDLYEEKILKEVSAKLNEYHNVDYSIRYWRILLGPWLGYFMQILFDRYEMVQKASREYSIFETYSIQGGAWNSIPSSSNDFVKYLVSDYWNQILYDEIISKTTEIFQKQIKVENTILSTSYLPEPNAWGKIKRFLGKFVYLLSEVGVKEEEAFFMSDYLPRVQSLKLQWVLKQIPRLRKAVDLVEIMSTRTKPVFQLEYESQNGFERLLKELIPALIPFIYVEGYLLVQNQIQELPWPKNPKFIFTSNSHNSDDLFKAWSAKKVEEGKKLFIGQHGGHYGTGLWSFNEEHEIAISDNYISWGWEDAERSNVVPAFNLKLVGEKEVQYDPQGKSLLVTALSPRYSYWSYSSFCSSQIISYFENQFQFIEALPLEIKNNTIIRLYPQDLNWSQVLRWKDQFPDIQLDNGSVPISKLFSQIRIYVSTYNATTYLESMYLNMPTIIYWNPDHWELRESAIPYFEELKKAGIFFHTPKEAAIQLQKVWDNIPNWWNSSQVQDAKNYFCSRFSRKSSQPMKDLKEIFLA